MTTAGLSEETLHQILVTAGHAYTIWIPGDRNPYISDSLAKFLGYFPESFSISHIGELIRYVHKQDRQRLLSILKTATHHGGNYECDFRILNAGGNYRWFRIRGTSYEHDEKGNPTRLIGCISDIDELKQAQLQAEEEKEKSEWLRNISTQLFESMDPGKMTMALDSLAKRLACNRTYLRLKNPVDGNLDIVTESYTEGLQPLQQIVAEKYPGILQKSFMPIDTGQDIFVSSIGPESTEIEQQLSRDFGTRYSAVIRLAQHGEIQGELVLMSAVDAHWSESDLQLAKEFSQLIALIFEREAIANSLRESDERFHLAMEASRDGLWDAQINLDRVYVSPSYFRMAGRDLPGGIYPREITGTYIHPDDLLMVREGLSKFIHSKKDNDSIEFRLLHKDGSEVWVLSRMYKAEFHADGSPSRVFGVNTDITEFKRIQNYLQAAQSEADAANRAKSEFLARMSHEIRTPMNAILGLSHLMLESDLQTEQRGYIKHIDDAAQLLLNVINDILDFSKIEAGKLELDETDFDLEKVINRLTNLLTYNAEQKKISLVVNLEPDVPLLLHGDVTRLQQILVNLLNNAIKFTEQGGVHFHVSMNAEKYFVFTVKDSGIGIDEESRQFLFTPFFQVDGSVTRRYGGTGLGLTICKYLVEMMGGTIVVESIKGKGSEFTVTLPFEIRAAEHNLGHINTEGVESSSFEQWQHCKVLLVEDNPVNQKVALGMFRKYGLDVEVVTDGQKAIDRLQQHEPDYYKLVFMDMEMPVMDGYAATREIRRHKKFNHLPIVAMTAHAMKGDRDRCLAAGMNDYLSKPINPTLLNETLAKYLPA